MYIYIYIYIYLSIYTSISVNTYIYIYVYSRSLLEPKRFKKASYPVPKGLRIQHLELRVEAAFVEDVPSCRQKRGLLGLRIP